MADSKYARCGQCMRWFLPVHKRAAIEMLTNHAAIALGADASALEKLGLAHRFGGTVRVALEQQRHYCLPCNRKHFPGVFSRSDEVDKRYEVRQR